MPRRLSVLFVRRNKADRLRAHAARNHLLQTDKRPAADKQDVRGIDRRELLVRMLAAALRRNIRDRAFQNLQQRLLHTFARNIARDGWILVLAADLVDFVDVDDAGLRSAAHPNRHSAADAE